MSRPPQASGERISRSPTVSSELEQIFVAATGRPSAGVAHYRSGRAVRGVSNSGDAPRRAPTAAFGAIAAMILAGASAFAVVYSVPRSSLSRPAAAAYATTPPAPTIAPVAAPPGELRPETSDVVVARSELAPSHHRVPIKMAQLRMKPHATPVRQIGQRDVILADLRLRRAYARAISAGVSQSIIVDYRNRWEDLRYEAKSRPERVVVSYRAMANDLTRMSMAPRRYFPREAFREADAMIS
jgi:hypothetical protein